MTFKFAEIWTQMIANSTQIWNVLVSSQSALICLNFLESSKTLVEILLKMLFWLFRWYVRKHLTEESGWVPAQYLKDEQTYTMYVQKKLVEKIEKLPVFDSKYFLTIIDFNSLISDCHKKYKFLQDIVSVFHKYYFPGFSSKTKSFLSWKSKHMYHNFILKMWLSTNLQQDFESGFHKKNIFQDFVSSFHEKKIFQKYKTICLQLEK